MVPSILAIKTFFIYYATEIYLNLFLVVISLDFLKKYKDSNIVAKNEGNVKYEKPIWECSVMINVSINIRMQLRRLAGARIFSFGSIFLSYQLHNWAQNELPANTQQTLYRHDPKYLDISLAILYYDMMVSETDFKISVKRLLTLFISGCFETGILYLAFIYWILTWP